MPDAQGLEVLHPSRLKGVTAVLVGVVGVAFGVVIIRTDTSATGAAFGYAWTAICGLGALAAVLRARPDACFVRLSPEGITLCEYRRTLSLRWADIAEIGVAENRRQPRIVRHGSVGITLSQRYNGSDVPIHGRTIMRRLTGFDLVLTDNYGWKARELATHLNALKERYTRGPDR